MKMARAIGWQRALENVAAEGPTVRGMSGVACVNGLSLMGPRVASVWRRSSTPSYCGTYPARHDGPTQSDRQRDGEGMASNPRGLITVGMTG